MIEIDTANRDKCGVAADYSICILRLPEFGTNSDVE